MTAMFSLADHYDRIELQYIALLALGASDDSVSDATDLMIDARHDVEGASSWCLLSFFACFT